MFIHTTSPASASIIPRSPPFLAPLSRIIARPSKLRRNPRTTSLFAFRRSVTCAADLKTEVPPGSAARLAHHNVPSPSHARRRRRSYRSRHYPASRRERHSHSRARGSYPNTARRLQRPSRTERHPWIHLQARPSRTEKHPRIHLQERPSHPGASRLHPATPPPRRTRPQDQTQVAP